MKRLFVVFGLLAIMLVLRYLQADSSGGAVPSAAAGAVPGAAPPEGRAVTGVSW